ncbi:MAG: hypothetical protein ACOCRK_10630 [bacterium]
MSDTKKKTAYRYFIYNIHEYIKLDYSILDSRRLDSFRSLLDSYFELYEEITNNFGNRNKYSNSLNNLIKTIIFYCNENPILKHPKLKNDLEHLKVLLMKKDNSDEIEIYHAISSIKKKLNTLNILDLCIDLIIDHIEDFAEVDKLIESYISELIYEGYSIKYLYEWWGQTFKSSIMKNISDKAGLIDVINNFRKLTCNNKTTYQIILKISVPNKLKAEINNFNNITISNIKYTPINNLHDFKAIHEDFINFFGSNKYMYLHAEVQACDVYKSIDIVKDPIENYIQIYKIIDKSIKNNIVNACLVKNASNSKWIEYPLHNSGPIIKEITNREKEDIEDYIDLRDSYRKNNIQSFDIATLERAINLLQKLPEFTTENRLLNIWTSLEYILKFYERNSIIEKARQIIPCVISLYFIKSKTNIFWDKLLPYIENGKLDLLNNCISSMDNTKYNKENLALFLIDENNARSLYDFFDKNVIIQRKIAELNSLLAKPKNLFKVIKFNYDSVKYDLNSIYRIRNKLVHSGGTISSEIEFYSHKLHKYVNCLLGTVIYHMKRSPQNNISEILYSIVQTYDSYIDTIISFGNIKENKVGENLKNSISKIAFPPYIYL